VADDRSAAQGGGAAVAVRDSYQELLADFGLSTSAEIRQCRARSRGCLRECANWLRQFIADSRQIEED
jgi:hypothetical protein